MLNKMNKELKDQEFWIGEKKRRRKESNCEIFAHPPSISIVQPSNLIFFLPSFFVLSLHRKDKNLFPTKIECRVGGYKREECCSKREGGHILEFLSSFHCYVQLSKSLSLTCNYLNFICNLVFGVKTMVLIQISLVLNSFPNLGFGLVMVNARF